MPRFNIVLIVQLWKTIKKQNQRNIKILISKSMKRDGLANKLVNLKWGIQIILYSWQTHFLIKLSNNKKKIIITHQELQNSMVMIEKRQIIIGSIKEIMVCYRGVGIILCLISDRIKSNVLCASVNIKE